MNQIDVVKRLAESLLDFPASYSEEAARVLVYQENEIEWLERRLHEVREIYAGMDGFIPQTALEGYCLRVIRQMYNAAMGENRDEN